jgi:two-component system NtrC family sensor kinase
LQRCLSLIEKEAGRCGDIVRNLLLFARHSGAELALHPLNSIIQNSVMLVQHHLDMNNIELDLVLLEDGRDRLVCDANQIQQALLALMVNAVEAMSDGGRLGVRVEDMGETLTIEIEDTGCGIPPEILPNIFEPFFSTKDKTEGVGLGLSVAYGIIQRHGGDIRVKSDPGEGTKFTVVLPRRPATDHTDQRESQHEQRESQTAARHAH